MPITKTTSATPLEAVTVEQGRHGVTHVWLRKNITESTVTDEEGSTQKVYTADEIYIKSDAALTVEDATAQFHDLWDHETQPTIPPLSDEEISLALAELGAMLATVIGGDL